MVILVIYKYKIGINSDVNLRAPVYNLSCLSVRKVKDVLLICWCYRISFTSNLDPALKAVT